MSKMLTLFETKDYRVACGTYPPGEHEGQPCYIIENKVTHVPEIYVNLLPKAIYLAKEAQEFLDDVYSDNPTNPSQLLLLN